MSDCKTPKRIEPCEPAMASALASLVREHSHVLLHRAVNLTHSTSDAWDLLQAALERAARTRPHWPSREDGVRWLFVVMRNLFHDEYRSRKIRRQVSLSESALHELPAPEAEPPPRWKCVSIEELHRMVPSLPPKLRAAFVCSLQGLSGREIARKLKIPVATVATRLFRCRQMLRRMFQSQLEERQSPPPRRESAGVVARGWRRVIFCEDHEAATPPVRRARTASDEPRSARRRDAARAVDPRAFARQPAASRGPQVARG